MTRRLLFSLTALLLASGILNAEDAGTTSVTTLAQIDAGSGGLTMRAVTDSSWG